MSKNIIYIGIDVDDNSFHVTGIIQKEEKLKLTATRKALLAKLKIYEKAFPEKMGMIHADLHLGKHSRSDNPKIKEHLIKYTKQTFKYNIKPYL